MVGPILISQDVFDKALEYVTYCAVTEAVQVNKSRLDHCQWIIESVAKGVLYIEVEGEFVDE